MDVQQLWNDMLCCRERGDIFGASEKAAAILKELLAGNKSPCVLEELSPDDPMQLIVADTVCREITPYPIANPEVESGNQSTRDVENEYYRNLR